jgi:virginiamycin B lyase
VAFHRVEETTGQDHASSGGGHPAEDSGGRPPNGRPEVPDLRPLTATAAPTDTWNVVARRRSTSSLVALAVAAASLYAPLAGTSATAVAPTWFDLPVTDSFPQGIATGPDGSAWVASRFADQIVRVRPDGTPTPFGLEFGVDPHTIAGGSDGAMWFTEHNGSRIGRITTSGDVTEFFIEDRSAPTGITAGPDGAMWFSQRGVSSIGRITTDGDVNSWRTITSRAAPLGIAAGSDGALWFTEPTVDRIGRITTGGDVSEYPLPAGSSPQWITAGPDGALWFTERGTNLIGRITTGGQLQHFPVPTASAGVNGITVGPDGAIWFTESAADAIGRIGMGGRVVEIPVGEGASPTGIAAGPDGEVWFSAPGVNRVGKILPAAAADTTPPTITIASPQDGSVLLQGEGLVADYWCTDEPGGSGIASCDGPVPDGHGLDTAPGAHTFTVTAADAEGNPASKTHGYVVFADLGGPIVHQAHFSAGRVIPIQLELGSRPPGTTVFADGFPVVHRTDCETGAVVGADEPADVQANLSRDGRLLLQWRTGAGWAGTCRSLVLRFAWAGWSDADAVFTLHFV